MTQSVPVATNIGSLVAVLLTQFEPFEISEMDGDNNSRYDRQLRLWAASGQSLLEASHVCLINATSLGCEALKNLVLPDDAKVGAMDLSSNFFLTEADLDCPRASAVLRNLLELNPNVSGNALVCDPVSKLSDIGFWEGFSVVIVCGGHSSTVDSLSDLLWSLKIPFIRLLLSGFYGSIKVNVPEKALTDSHMELKGDLRLDQPWPKLLQHVNAIAFEELDDTEHAHIPPIVIVVKAFQKWKNETKCFPENRKEKEELRLAIGSLQRSTNEQNFDEAVDLARKLTNSKKIVLPLKPYLTMLNDIDWNSNISPFWFYLLALKQFLDQNNGLPPLSGDLPDMASDTKSYIILQRLYREKAEEDFLKFHAILHDLLRELEKSVEEFTDETSRLFCKNSRQVIVQHGTHHQVSKKLENENDDIMKAIYLCLLATTETNHTQKASLEDIERFVKSSCERYTITLSDETLESVSEEVIRTYGSETANIASFMGGIAAQEVLKQLTNQYVPLDNCLVFDGIRSVTSSFEV
ncbi:unnamed protein product [Kuraishia capsulata CBS 1993]|uniref:NEDD8-activating enzyme E1 regulatory subunit n=1 Tax=Kuraishia capsulata CBS 1993 TaxID=1382522 RepID=W6ML08_9ASCO|nr:uncharacterized protein KUCA_T00002742001 [Kuraishia capsulata CBS 1993]CDK26768.1 unnamed protein product [Kuraishia capsulata CBS 1993]